MTMTILDKAGEIYTDVETQECYKASNALQVFAHILKTENSIDPDYCMYACSASRLGAWIKIDAQIINSPTMHIPRPKRINVCLIKQEV